MFRRKKKSEAIRFTTVDGQQAQVPLTRSPLFKIMKYSVMHDHVETVGQMVDVAVGALPGLVAEGLVHEHDAGRVLAMIHHLRSFEFEPRFEAPRLPLAALPVGRLSDVLRAGVTYLFDDDRRIVPLIGLEAAYLVEALAFGAREEYPRDCAWALDGRVTSDGRVDDGLDDDKRWKKQFTQRLIGLTVLARAGEDVEFLTPDGLRVVRAGTEFQFGVWRCPLSSASTDEVHFVVRARELLRDVWPFGGMVVGTDHVPLGREAGEFGRTWVANGTIPWRWVTAYLDRRGEVAQWVPMPAFRWEAVTP